MRSAGAGAGELHRAIGQFAFAAKQVAVVGNATQIEQASAIANDARKKLYQLLAED
jgi:hypothetical protein